MALLLGWCERWTVGSGSSPLKMTEPVSASCWRRRTSKSPDYLPRNFSSAQSLSNRLYVIASAVAVGFHRYTLRRIRSEEHTSELQSRRDLVCRLLLEK